MIIRHLLVFFAVLFALPAPVVNADPCGMVPPIWIGNGPAIRRIGAQRTYVFHRDGMESVVIHPGFEGKVEDFGMLIPFPAPPSLRKVSDNTFDHIAAAIDPPEVIIGGWYDKLAARGLGGSAMLEVAVASDAVVVLREEAVGMYEIAVLDAGSAAALSRWMKQHGYQYPDGMDEVCEEYIEEGWCFVAVKTRVGSRAAVDPRPGMREADAARPAGSTFDGHVQAMGFRFPSETPVVPMRLSTYNDGDLHNIVYVLAESPVRIRNIDTAMVVRQIPGTTLLGNVQNLLPIRVIGKEKIDTKTIDAYLPQRDPGPFNGFAKELFASDLLASFTGQLSLEFEEQEKALLAIGESLELRGAEIDALHHTALQEERDRLLATALPLLREMCMTVIDGTFPREVIANENLYFDPFTMASEKNNPEAYDAKQGGPLGKQEGRIIRTSLNGVSTEEFRGAAIPSATIVLLGALALAALWLLLAGRHRGAALALIATLMVVPISRATSPLVDPEPKTIPVTELIARGHAIVSISQRNDSDAAAQLEAIATDPHSPPLVIVWARAAQIRLADVDELITLAECTGQYASLNRPFEKRLAALQARGGLDTLALVKLATRRPVLARAAAKATAGMTNESLIHVLFTAEENNVRRMAAALIASLVQQDPKRGTAETLAAEIRFWPGAAVPPWGDKPLFIPAINWDTPDARRLTAHLLRWHLWADQHEKTDLQRVLHNNLRSLQLAQSAGYKSPGWVEPIPTLQWLAIWRNAFGMGEVTVILEEQGVRNDPRYGSLWQ